MRFEKVWGGFSFSFFIVDRSTEDGETTVDVVRDCMQEAGPREGTDAAVIEEECMRSRRSRGEMGDRCGLIFVRVLFIYIDLSMNILIQLSSRQKHGPEKAYVHIFTGTQAQDAYFLPLALISPTSNLEFLM